MPYEIADDAADVADEELLDEDLDGTLGSIPQPTH
jgi:hypothetical protein